MNELPVPLVHANLDLRDFPYMPLDVVRLRDSDLAAAATAEEFRAAVLLWCASWHQIPAGSLPDEDIVLSRLAGFGRAVNEWREHKTGALKNWIKCLDGRLYHPTVSSKANEAWEAKQKQRERTAAARAARLSQQPSSVQTGPSGNVPADVTTTVTENVTSSNGREGNRRESTSLTIEDNDKPSGPKRVRTRHKYSDEFERFWQAYPTDANMGKLEAWQEWIRLSPEDQTAAIASCPKFRAYCASRKDYRPVHANRYLAKRRFDGHAAVGAGSDARAFIKIGTAQWDAWDAWYRRNKKLAAPVNREGTGYWFATEWPNSESATTQGFVK